MGAPRPGMQNDHHNEIDYENDIIINFISRLNEYNPPIPDPVINNILAEAGCNTSDKRVSRIFNLACQKFIRDVLEQCRNNERINNPDPSYEPKKYLQVGDVKEALKTKDIHVHRPDYIVGVRGENEIEPDPEPEAIEPAFDFFDPM